MTALAFRPEGFPLVGDHGLRIAKTEPILDDDDDGSTIPPLRLYFQISETGTVVFGGSRRYPVTKNSHSDPSKNQKEKFIRTARELGCDEDPEAFKRAVRKLAKAPPARRKQ